MAESSPSSEELCVACSSQPFDLTCSCGGKFDFFCINIHVEEIRLEFEFIQSETGQKLLELEQAAENNDCAEKRTMVENWRQKRLKDINSLADDALSEIERRENTYEDVATLRTQYNSLSQNMGRVVHQQLHSMYSLQQKTKEKTDQLEKLPAPIQDDIALDSKLKKKLNPTIFGQNSTTTTNTAESAVVTSATDEGNNILVNTEQSGFNLMTNVNTNSPDQSTNVGHIILAPPRTINPPPAAQAEDKTESPQQDNFNQGLTSNIELENPIIIPTHNDTFAGTLCCHDSQLLYNNYNPRNGTCHLILVPDVEQPTSRQTIPWADPDASIGGGDNNWIQDITYSATLKGYLLLNCSRLRFLRNNRNVLEEFYQFPDRSMKRVTCDDKYIYVLSVGGATNHYGDEIILLNYDKEEKACKSFRDIISGGRNDATTSTIGEISDFAVNNHGQIMLAYRLKHRKQVRLCIFNLLNGGNTWTIVKQLLLNECWDEEKLFTPRMEWCEKFRLFVVVEYITSHLIMLDESGQVKGESSFTSVQNAEETPLNISISNNDWICARYVSSINIHRLSGDRF
ncbi:unnamed protein product [Rotaria socialis]|uniref:Uncharacterized protein n=3 Tax=Rotaria socialis TaxID=392032 RepID=A0A817ZM99_9BILA|nr:unnamed protein product [Rotaria socialis]CAF3393045.1 unnamed protein product [Rotaria socialis]CAF4226076.1 unnamed protein product [Rotaria socialis]CAF4506615.1 unnamed protein product [Rotaria socialis]